MQGNDQPREPQMAFQRNLLDQQKLGNRARNDRMPASSSLQGKNLQPMNRKLSSNSSYERIKAQFASYHGSTKPINTNSFDSIKDQKGPKVPATTKGVATKNINLAA